MQNNAYSQAPAMAGSHISSRAEEKKRTLVKSRNPVKEDGD